MRTPRAYLAHRAELDRRRSGRALDAGRRRCSISPAGTAGSERRCSRGASAYRGVDSTPEMVEEARRRLGEPRRVDLGDLNDYVPPEPVAATTRVSRDLLRARPPRVLRARRRVHREEARLRPQPPPVPRSTTSSTDLRAAGFGRVELRPFFVPQTVSLPRPAPRGRPGARAQRPARPARAPLPLHLSRRGVALASEERLEARLDEHARRAGGGRCSTGRSRSGRTSERSSISIRHGSLGAASVTPFASQSRHDEGPRPRHALDPRLVVGPDADRADRDRRLAGLRFRASGTSRPARA